jgi:hypothetical protein
MAWQATTALKNVHGLCRAAKTTQYSMLPQAVWYKPATQKASAANRPQGGCYEHAHAL